MPLPPRRALPCLPAPRARPDSDAAISPPRPPRPAPRPPRRAGIRHFRVELVDEPAAAVGPLLEGYRAVLEGTKRPAALWRELEAVPDANGRAHGVSYGSLRPARERSADSLRPSARRS